MSENNQAESNELRDHLAKLIEENEVILFMKGTPDGPACGFSARAVAVMNQLPRKYAAVDILPDPRIREELTALSEWPTIPQLFVDGKLVGGSDIMMEMFESGELAKALGVEQPAPSGPPMPTEVQPQNTGLQLENNLE
jgi:monothiol glutaredoxin